MPQIVCATERRYNLGLNTAEEKTRTNWWRQGFPTCSHDWIREGVVSVPKEKLGRIAALSIV